MNAKLLVRYRCQKAEYDTQTYIEAQVPQQPGFSPKGPHLAEKYEKYYQDNNHQGCNGTRLLMDIMACKPLQGDEFECVVRDRGNPAGTEPQDRLLNLGGKADQSSTDVQLVHDLYDE